MSLVTLTGRASRVGQGRERHRPPVVKDLARELDEEGRSQPRLLQRFRRDGWESGKVDVLCRDVHTHLGPPLWPGTRLRLPRGSRSGRWSPPEVRGRPSLSRRSGRCGSRGTVRASPRPCRFGRGRWRRTRTASRRNGCRGRGRSRVPRPGEASPSRAVPFSVRGECGRYRPCPRAARISSCSRPSWGRSHPPVAALIDGKRTCRIWRTPGPRITMKSAGKRRKTSGKTSLMVVFAAASSARWRRRIRRESEWTRRDLGEARPQPLRLDQHGDEGFDVLHARAVRESPESLHPGLSGHHLPVDDVELLAQRRTGEAELLGDPEEGGVDPQPRLDADRQQVQRVGEGVGDRLLPFPGFRPKEGGGQGETGCGACGREQEERLVGHPDRLPAREQDRREEEGRRDPDPAVDPAGRRGAVPRLGQQEAMRREVVGGDPGHDLLALPCDRIGSPPQPRDPLPARREGVGGASPAGATTARNR